MTNPLKNWRSERKLTQVELGELLGVDGMTVSRWERGNHLPHKRHWRRIEEATGIAPSQLVDGVNLNVETTEPVQ